MSDVQIIEAGSDITPGTGGQTEYEAELMARTDLPEVKPEFAGDSPVEPDEAVQEAAEEKELKELQDAALEAEKAIAAYRAARLAFVRKHTEYPKGDLLDKAPSPLHESLALYIGDKTGHHVDSTVVKVVQLTLALHGEHQQSPEWKIKREQIAAERQAATKKVEKVKAEKNKAKVAKKVDAITEALNAGIEMLKTGAKLPDDVMAGLRAAAEAKGIVLPGDEPKEVKTEEKPAKPERPSRAAKAAVGKAISAEAKVGA